MKSNSPSMMDLARATGLSIATVSVALRGKVGASQETRARVQAAAERLGYVPNPVAALLAKQRGNPNRKNQLTVGFLSEPTYSDAPFLALCEELGIQGHCFRLTGFESPEAASRILWSRGISGLILTDLELSWSAEDRMRFKWDPFSLVKLTRGLPDVPCHLVRHDAFDYMEMTLRQVVAHGYRRIAVHLGHSLSAIDDNARRGAVLNFQARLLPPGVSLVWREDEGLDARTAKWLRAERPDAIVIFVHEWAHSLQQLGWKFPGKTGLASVLTAHEKLPDLPIVSGCAFQHVEHLRRALVMLTELIGRGERGFPANTLESVIEPLWVEGETLPKRK